MNSNAQWEAILKRDEAADGRFVYAVRSTGIYCRPSCASRKPNKNNVLIFEFPEMAEARGFRPCLRCAPQDAGYDPRLEKVRKAVRHIEEHADENPTLAELGRCVGVSPNHLQRTFKRALGVSPRQYLESLESAELQGFIEEWPRPGGRGLRGRVRLEQGGLRGRLALSGHDARHVQKGGEGVSIRYGITTCRLGRLLVAATGKGVCRVSIGERVGETRRRSENEYPHANLHRSDDN